MGTNNEPDTSLNYGFSSTASTKAAVPESMEPEIGDIMPDGTEYRGISPRSAGGGTFKKPDTLDGLPEGTRYVGNRIIFPDGIEYMGEFVPMLL